MEVSRIRALRGPNIWSRHTAIEAVVECAPAERSIAALEGFEARIRALFPGLGPLRHDSNEGPVSLAHVLEAAGLALQSQAGCPVTYSRTSTTSEAGIYQVVIEYSEEAVGRQAFDLSLALIQAAQNNTSFDIDEAIAKLRETDEDERLGPSTGSIVEAALKRGIPYRRLTSGSLVQFGWGSRQRRIQAAEVDTTSAVAESIAQDKDLTKMLLRAAGVPVPLGRPATSPDDAWAAALEIGLPVVLKPQDGNQGKGVTVNIVDRAHLDLAYKAAADIGEVLVEKYLPGNDFRLLVVGDRLVAAARRDPPQVIGDGVHTVRELVDIVNADPRRGPRHLADQDPLRRHRHRPPGPAGPETRIRAAQGPARDPAQQRQPEHRRHCHRCDRRRAPRGGRPRGGRRPDGGHAHLRRRRGLRKRAAPAGRAARWHRRSERRPRPAHAPDALVRQGPPGG